MDDRVAIGANRPEISNWINAVGWPDSGKGLEVMYMDKACHQWPRDQTEIDTAKLACCSVMCDARGSCACIPLVTVD
jgi:hypothetical protein